MRDRYLHWNAVIPRWRDNDIYGHINNAVFYEYVDSVVNAYLIANGLDIHTGEIIGVAASSSCEYHAPLTYPGPIDAGLVVTQLGTASVHYEVGLFAEGSNDPAAVGTFVHVFVDRASRESVPIPDSIRGALAAIAIE